MSSDMQECREALGDEFGVEVRAYYRPVERKWFASASKIITGIGTLEINHSNFFDTENDALTALRIAIIELMGES